MTDFTFTLRFLAPAAHGGLDALSVLIYGEIDDASLSGPDSDGSYLLEFDRRATSLPRALTGAVKELARTVPGARILRVEADDLATIADIARRSERSAESVRLLILGKRGPGNFPPAAGRLDARTKLWRWSDVEQWFSETMDELLTDTDDTLFCEAFNEALTLADLSPRLTRAQQTAIGEILPGELAV